MKRLLFLLFLLFWTAAALRAAGPGGVSETANELEFLPAKLEKKVLQVSPRLSAISRDRLIRSSILAETGLTQLKAQTVYNAITQELSYRLWYGFRTRPVVFGFSVLDRIEFEKAIPGGAKIIGRERQGGVELTAPLRGKAACILNLSGGEYTTILSTHPWTVFHDQTFTQEWTLGLFPLTRGARLTYTQGVRFLQSDFQYQCLEAEAGLRIPHGARRWIVATSVTAGTPIRRRGVYPFYEHYFLGGYETLPGWRLYELEGESAVYGHAALRIPFYSGPPPRRHLLRFSELSCVGHLHFAAVGGEEVFRESGPYRFSTTLGPRLGFTVRGGTLISLQGEWCHPVHAGRRDVFYVSLGVS